MHSPTPTPVCSSTVLGEQLHAAWSGSKANVDTAGLCHKDLGVRAVRRATLADPGRRACLGRISALCFI